MLMNVMPVYHLSSPFPPLPYQRWHFHGIYTYNECATAGKPALEILYGIYDNLVNKLENLMVQKNKSHIIVFYLSEYLSFPLLSLVMF